MIAFTLFALGQHGTKDVLGKNNAVCQSLANGNPLMTTTQLPTMPVMMRRRRGRRRWWWRGWRRWWRRRRYEMPAVVVMMMVLDASTVHVSSGRSALAPLGYPLAPYGSLGPHFVRRVCHSDPCDCDSRKRNVPAPKASGCPTSEARSLAKQGRKRLRDEFDLVHCRVPFIFAQAHSRAYTELGLFSQIF